MRVLVTGSAGHLGEALMLSLPAHGHDPVGLDILPSPHTHHVGSITDRALVREALAGCDAVIHAATLHKPHVATHSRQAFVDVNISGTLALLDEAAAAGVSRFVFTSTTSAFGRSLRPGPDDPAVWIDETVPSVPKNIYGATKTAAEDLCRLAHHLHGLPCVVLRTSRFFPEDDDDPATRARYPRDNSQANELLYRRLDLEDAVTAHLCALDRAPAIGFGLYIVSATTPFTRADLAELRRDPAAVVACSHPEFAAIYAAAGYHLFPDIGRVYDNARARRALGWRPRYDFAAALERIARGEPIGSALARRVGIKGYHPGRPADEIYPTVPS